jgi:hypothetical protein
MQVMTQRAATSSMKTRHEKPVESFGGSDQSACGRMGTPLINATNGLFSIMF